MIKSKNYVLLRDIVTVYHPDFSTDKKLKKIALSNPDYFNVERLVEVSLAHIGGYKFVDEFGYDFDDYTDSKTTSVQPSGKCIDIGSVECKIGSLRVTIYNPFKHALDYMFIPKSDVPTLKVFNYGKNSQKERIRTTWNQKNDSYNCLEQYRLSSFIEMATTMD
jgi:hypothetical protein